MQGRRASFGGSERLDVRVRVERCMMADGKDLWWNDLMQKACNLVMIELENRAPGVVLSSLFHSYDGGRYQQPEQSLELLIISRLAHIHTLAFTFLPGTQKGNHHGSCSPFLDSWKGTKAYHGVLEFM